MSTKPEIESVIAPLDPQGDWTILGPGGGGAMYVPTIQPGNPERVLVSCDMTGAYLTTDGGQSWRQVNFKGRATAFAFSPAEPQTVYAGATGLYRSRDGGESWRLIFPAPHAVTNEKFSGDHGTHSYQSTDHWPGGDVQVIFVDPEDAFHLLIGIKTDRPCLYESRDEGASWSAWETDALSSALAPSPALPVINGALSPNPNIENWVPWEKASEQNFKKIAALPFTAGGADSLLLVASRLFSFRMTERQLTRLPVPGGAPVSDFCCTRHPLTGESVLFVTTQTGWQNGVFHSGLYRSQDGGLTWEQCSTGLDAGLAPGEARLINRVAACATEGSILYCSAVERDLFPEPSPCFGIFSSRDLGQSWQWAMKVSPGQPENRAAGWVENEFRPAWGGAPFYLQAAPDNPEVCYATDWATAYRTINGGRTWQQVYCQVRPDGSAASRGLDVINVNSIRFDPHAAGHIVMGCADVGAFQSFNAGQSWSYCARGVPAAWVDNCYQLAFDPAIPGKAWGVWSGCHDIPRQKMFRPGSLHTFAGGVCLTTDHLASWRTSSRGLPGALIPTSIVLDPQSLPGQRVLYIAAVGKGVYRSGDDGETWTLKNSGLGAAPNAWQLVLLPDGRLILLVCRGWEDGRPVPGKMYHSTDSAETWRALPLPPGVSGPNDCCCDPHDPLTLFLAAWPDTAEGEPRDGGLWASRDGGESWQCIFPDHHFVYGVCCDPHRPGRIYLTTFEGAVYASPDHGQTWRQMPGIDFKYIKQPCFDPRDREYIYVATYGSSIWRGKVA